MIQVRTLLIRITYGDIGLIKPIDYDLMKPIWMLEHWPNNCLNSVVTLAALTEAQDR